MLKKSLNMFLQCLRHYPFSLLVTFAIVLLSLLPMPEIEMMNNVQLADKWTHMIMYGTLTFVIWVEYLRRHRKLQVLRLVCFAFLLPVGIGGALELAQAYGTTCRSGEWLDFVANGIGVCLASVAALILHRFRHADSR